VGNLICHKLAFLVYRLQPSAFGVGAPKNKNQKTPYPCEKRLFNAFLGVSILSFTSIISIVFMSIILSF
jgi:hypothetical protein